MERWVDYSSNEIHTNTDCYSFLVDVANSRILSPLSKQRTHPIGRTLPSKYVHHLSKATLRILISHQIFDIPSRKSEAFEERVAYLKKHMSKIPQVNVVEHTMCNSRDHLLATLKDVERDGGEGVMLRQPGSEYEGKRSSSLLKVKVSYLVRFRI